MPTGPALRAGDTCLCPLMDGPKPHGDGVASGAQLVHLATSLLSGEPRGPAPGVSNGAVERERELERDPRPIRNKRVEERRIQLPRGRTLDVERDIDVRGAKPVGAAGRCR